MESSVEIAEDGIVEITVRFEELDREFGKWRWFVQFMLGTEKNKQKTIVWGAYEPKMGEFLGKFVATEAEPYIRALLDKGKYRAITVMPVERVGSGVISVIPNPEVQTVGLDTETINTLRDSLDYIQHRS